MDNAFVTGSVDDGIKEMKNSLHSSFKMKHLEPLTYFLGLSIHRSLAGYMVHQNKYLRI